MRYGSSLFRNRVRRAGCAAAGKGFEMPKQKTRKAVAKRFKLTGTGKVKRASAGRGHLLSGKTGKRKRQLRKASALSPADRRRVIGQIA